MNQKRNPINGSPKKCLFKYNYSYAPLCLSPRFLRINESRCDPFIIQKEFMTPLSEISPNPPINYFYLYWVLLDFWSQPPPDPHSRFSSAKNPCPLSNTNMCKTKRNKWLLPISKATPLFQNQKKSIFLFLDTKFVPFPRYTIEFSPLEIA